MVASVPTMWAAVVTDQVYRASHGNRSRRQAFASGEDRSRFNFVSSSSKGRLTASQVVHVGDTDGTLDDPDGLIDYHAAGNGPAVLHAGHYFVAGSLGINTHPWSTGTAVQLWFSVNGTSYFATSHSVTSSAGIYVSTMGAISLSAGDKVTMWASTSAASTAILTYVAFSLFCVGW